MLLPNTIIGNELRQDGIYAPFDLGLYLKFWSGANLDPLIRPLADRSDVRVTRLSDYFHRSDDVR